MSLCAPIWQINLCANSMRSTPSPLQISGITRGRGRAPSKYLVWDLSTSVMTGITVRVVGPIDQTEMFANTAGICLDGSWCASVSADKWIWEGCWNNNHNIGICLQYYKNHLNYSFKHLSKDNYTSDLIYSTYTTFITINWHCPNTN